eukprot:CAMPEP_0174332070 /NCGR_PEP_ID=MMETSP0810-20121108/18005_1 /TAXON_ID=73025 ORGANISM="Eutreptiella gymnastica-like, Strain CCMP1594" /NCGR_SAMPLE_ID=MMETSP0810 /ASSEMBLY_ACC=CAM_ASM_000659 /LENGTH=36 /DNA_ID= /DNA_START= /DNA_END= /DNA_ORIENTATION=
MTTTSNPLFAVVTNHAAWKLTESDNKQEPRKEQQKG